MLKKSFFSILLIIILLASLLFLSSCSSGEPKFIRLDGFIGGTRGLKINVLEGAPPSVIMDMGIAPFSVIVALENVGEAPVGPGTDNPFVMVRLAGILHNSFGLTPQESAKTLDAKLESAKMNFDSTILPGEISYVSFDDLVYRPDVFDTLVLTMRVEACYDYESYASAKFCMKKDVLESWEDASICTLRGYKPLGTSGAPIQVTSIREAPLNNEAVQINIGIEHLGRGVFFYRGQTQDLLRACDFSELNQDIDKIEVFVEPIEKDAYDFECARLDTELAGGGAYGIVRMPQGAPITINCFVTRTKPMNVRIYEDMLSVRLKYRYAEFLEVPIMIQGHP